LAVFSVQEEGLILIDKPPNVTLQEIIEKTGAHFEVDQNLIEISDLDGVVAK
jgi:3-oxoacid CoA-transferase/3-oxoacid CoA-transferase subunit B